MVPRTQNMVRDIRKIHKTTPNENGRLRLKKDTIYYRNKMFNHYKWIEVEPPTCRRQELPEYYLK